MKVLFVNTFDEKGGAARAIMRIMKGVRADGIDARMLVQEKQSDDPTVLQPESWLQRTGNFFRPYLDFIPPFIQSRERVLFSPAMIPDSVVEQIHRIDPDIVHLNWINGGFIRIESLAKIKKPMIWTFQDMWAFTGGCHYSVDCTRYLDSCGICPVLHSSRENDLSRKVFLRKEIVYPQIGKLTITTLSKWLARCVTESPLFNRRDVEVIPNGLDTNLFYPINKLEARKKLDLPVDRKLVLFGAIRGVNSPIKGFHHLAKALTLINDPSIELVIVGSSSPGKEAPAGIKTHCFGHVSNDKMLVD
ncbi:MAG: glycosyltransferase, partial [Bacteroidia bacterium]|nr:glycosyltransferase [Bacteroidia bacterium]